MPGLLHMAQLSLSTFCPWPTPRATPSSPITHFQVTCRMSCRKEVAWARAVSRLARTFCSLVSSRCSCCASACCCSSCRFSASLWLLAPGPDESVASLPQCSGPCHFSLAHRGPHPAPSFSLFDRGSLEAPLARGSHWPVSRGHKGMGSRLLPPLAPLGHTHLRASLSFCSCFRRCSSGGSRRRRRSASTLSFCCSWHFSLSMRMICGCRQVAMPWAHRGPLATPTAPAPGSARPQTMVQTGHISGQLLSRAPSSLGVGSTSTSYGVFKPNQETLELGPAAQRPTKEGPIPSLLPPSWLGSSLARPCRAVFALTAGPLGFPPAFCAKHPDEGLAGTPCGSLCCGWP